MVTDEQIWTWTQEMAGTVYDAKPDAWEKDSLGRRKPWATVRRQKSPSFRVIDCYSAAGTIIRATLDKAGVEYQTR